MEETIAAIGPESTVFEVCNRLFRPGLTVHETRFAIGETVAHIEYLWHDGKCRKEIKDGK